MENPSQHITVNAEISPELATLIDRCAQLKLEVDGFTDAFEVCFESFDRLVKLTQVNGDLSSATRTREVRVTFEPSDRFRDFVAAFAG